MRGRWGDIQGEKAPRAFAQRLRKHATREENHLWYDFLRAYPVPFHRQKVFGPYIVDFYCHKVRLVVELDGGQHYERERQKADLTQTG